MTVSPPLTLFDDILEFLVSTLEQIVALQPSKALQVRFEEFAENSREAQLSPEERAELDEIMRMNHFMNRLKIRAWRKTA